MVNKFFYFFFLKFFIIKVFFTDIVRFFVLG